jgi:hypothetical protein
VIFSRVVNICICSQIGIDIVWKLVAAHPEGTLTGQHQIFLISRRISLSSLTQAAIDARHSERWNLFVLA